MGILGGKFTNDEDDGGGGGEALHLTLDDMVCPTCGTDLPPWVSACPDDGATPVPRDQTGPSGPAIPTHLLNGLDDTVSDPARDED